MKITIFCNITMQEKVEPIGYKSEDSPFLDSKINAIYPINSFLYNNVSIENEIKCVLIFVNDHEKRYLDRINEFKKEFINACGDKCKEYSFVEIGIPYDFRKACQSELIRNLVKEIDDNSNILADITYGYKDLPIILFATLAFAIKHLNCECNYILYRQVFFKEGKPINPILCNKADMLHLISVIYSLECTNSNNSRKMIDILLNN